MAVELQDSSALPKGLRYYLLRGGAMVPLVPVDQLPFQLQGIPRQLTHRQMSDEEWKLLKETNGSALLLSIQAPVTMLSPQTPSTTKLRYLAPDHDVRTESMGTIDETSRSTRWSSPRPRSDTMVGQPRVRSGASPESPTSLVDSFASIYHKDAHRLGYRIPYPSGIEPDLSKKEYCTHWIKTGECAFISIGCKYKHEMPAIDKLRDIGFSQVPKWWKDKSAINTRGPTWMQRRLASGIDEEQPSEPPIARSMPSSSTSRSKYCDNLKSLSDGVPRELSISKQPSHTAAAALPVNTTSNGNQDLGLLIDFHEENTPAYSPQLYSSLSSNAGSCGTQTPPSSRSASPSPSPEDKAILQDQPAAVTRRSVNSATKKLDQQQQDDKPLIDVGFEHDCQSSYTSDDSGIVPPTKFLGKTKSISRRTKEQQVPTSPKKTGLSASKYATNAGGSITSNHVKTSSHYARNGGGRWTTPQAKASISTQGATELPIKAGQRKHNNTINNTLDSKERVQKVDAKLSRTRAPGVLGQTNSIHT